MSSSGIISGTPTEAGKFKVKISAANSAKTTEKSYKLTVFANTTQSSTSQTAENITSNSGYITSNSGYIAQNVVMDDVAFTGEYRIVADLGTISVDEAGMYDFTVTLSDDAPAGKELLYLAGSNEPSEDDTIAEFFDETGEEVSTVPESRNVTVSVWLKKDVIYTPSLAVRY